MITEKVNNQNEKHMSIHEKYNERKEQFLRYSAEIEVYNTQMDRMISQLKDNVAAMRNATENISNSEIKSSIQDVLEKLEQCPSLADNPELLNECCSELNKLASMLEQDIRRSLDD